MSAVLLLHGHAARLPLADASVHTIATSPPFYGLRQYDGLAPTPWPGGTCTAVPGLAPLSLPGPASWEALASFKATSMVPGAFTLQESGTVHMPLTPVCRAHPLAPAPFEGTPAPRRRRARKEQPV